MDFFTSDQHYGHSNIIKYCNRPFATSEEMDEVLIENWNKKVTSPDDTVYHLGDFAFKYSSQEIINIINRLNGKKVFILGNHDGANLLGALHFLKLKSYQLLDLKIKDAELGTQHVTLCHYPMISWNQSHRGAWNLFGHHHGSVKDISKFLTPRHLDLSVENHNYSPISFDEVKVLITKQHMERTNNDICN
jgi:calcineurin-like phosphoesterase family protein